MTPEPYNAGWMPGDVYDRLRAEEFAKFCKAASLDRSAHVPTCPDWDVRALCDHLGDVYQSRAFIIEHSARKSPDDFERLDGDTDPIEWVTKWSDTLNRALINHDDGDPTISFIPEANTMHFWRRRMALETLVHRTDAEIATGSVSGMDNELSADGVAELLWFGSKDSDLHHSDGNSDSSVVALTDGSNRWMVTLYESELVAGDTDAAVDATVLGSAPALLLTLSGRDIEGIGPKRFGVELPVVEGNPDVFQRLLARLGGF
jgi:uncharacterized protein (TIGR03083 family)